MQTYGYYSLAAMLILIGVCDAAINNCTELTDGRTQSCFTCMGRDYDNCMTGLTCCKGSCFKLIDKVHDLIIKGCEKQREEDASMKVRTLDINLYWDKNSKVKGESYFCNGPAFCNSDVTNAVPMLAFIPIVRLFL